MRYNKINTVESEGQRAMGDTNEISKGCLTHYDNRHIQVRLDFLGLCAYDKDLFDEKRKEEPNQECMAKILRLFETLTDHARTGWQLKAINAKEKGLTVPQEPKEYRFELTNGAIISLIYNTFGESTVRNSLDYLIHLGYIGRYQEKKNSIPVYWLNTQKLQPLLKEQAENELSGFEITPQTTKGLKSHPKRPKSHPSPTISNPSTPKSDTSGFESTDNNISNNKDNITEKERNERESTPNIADTHTFVSSDTARATTFEAYSFIVPTNYVEALAYLAPHGGVPPGYTDAQVLALAQKLYAEAQQPEHTHEGIEHPFVCYYDGQYYAACPLEEMHTAPRRKSILVVRLADGTETLGQVERYEGKDTIRVIWLEPQGQYVQAWSNGYKQKHFPYESSLPVPPDPNHTNHGFQAFGEYRILSEDEIASLAIIPLYRRIDQQTPQGDAHAVPASGHSHRVGDAAACGDNTSHTAVDSGQVATPEARPVLEAQEEITEGEYHGHRVPTLPAANPAASSQPTPPRHTEGHSDSAALSDNGLPVVRAVGSGTPCPQAGKDTRDAGKDGTAQVVETSPTPMPAQPLSPSPQAEQAALGMTFVEARDYLRALGYFLEPVPAMNGNWEIREPGERGFSVICGDEVRGIAEYQRKKHTDQNGGVTAFQEPVKPNENADQKAAKPLVEPDMSGKWCHEKCVEYAEWCNQRRYTEKMHEEQLKAAHAIHKNDVALTLEQFKQAYDERNDAWWKEHRGKLHVNDMKARGSSGIDRVHEMLQRIEDSASRSRAQPRLQVVTRQSTVKRYSSYDDPNFRSDQDFYPVEGGSYATASV